MMEMKDLDKYGIDSNLVLDYINKAKNGEKIITVTGEFSSGKSTFINALINKKRFLASSNLECTPVLIDLFKDNEEYIEIKYNDGTTKILEATKENILIYTKNKYNYDKNIVCVSIPVDSDFLDDKYHIVDTPGTNTVYKEHEIITNEILRKSDIVLYVFDTELTKYDLEKIESIKEYTNDIIFIMTHMDENIDGEYKNNDFERIQNCLDKALLSLEQLDWLKEKKIYPIGSWAVYNDTSLIDILKVELKEIIDKCNEEKVKENIKKQLGLLFKKRIDEIIDEADIARKLLQIDNKALNSEVDKLKNNIRNVESVDSEMIRIFNKIAESTKNNLSKNIDAIYKAVEKVVLKKLFDNLDMSEKKLLEIISLAKNVIDKEIKECLDRNIEKLISSIYLENNIMLENLNVDLDIKLNIKLIKPTLETLDLSSDKDFEKLYNHSNTVESMIVDLEEQIIEVSNKIANNKDNINGIEESRIDILKSINEKGEYKAEYKEIIEEGASSQGKVVGRVVGEFVDIALIFFSPANGALKMADIAKDSIKIGTLAGQGMKSMNKLSINGNEVVKALDLFTIGGIGEKVGSVLGNIVRPRIVKYVEDNEVKEVWKSEMEEINNKKIELEKEKYKLEKEIESDKLSIIEISKKKHDLDAQINLNNQKQNALLAKKKMDFKNDSDKIVEDSYRSQINSSFYSECEETKSKVISIVTLVIDNIIERSLFERRAKLEALKSQIYENTSKQIDLEKKLAHLEILLNDINKYETWIKEWV